MLNLSAMLPPSAIGQPNFAAFIHPTRAHMDIWPRATITQLGLGFCAVTPWCDVWLEHPQCKAAILLGSFSDN